MIDEYGNEQTVGSKEFEEYLHYRMDKEFCNDIACGDMNKDLAIQYAHEFYTYALGLQSKVKRLRKEVKDYHTRLQNLWDSELIPEDTDFWIELKELLEVD
jgi:hypothetical protein